VRDLLSAKVPLILRQDIYASAAIAGIVVYLLIRASRASAGIALGLGFLTVLGTRLVAIEYDLRLPTFILPGAHIHDTGPIYGFLALTGLL
jgi:uncharacterized membrane protein YeiH